ncbi:DUF3237 domain-containing protein [Mycolicibacterium thermoresistibile]|uniref:Uncharacterized protein n=2 Tax=Mycolicibacterium thermoresistibile TaxID=1797 RepID=G7CFU7_MYCT3|nr:DUF3237 domain-containing protein [Mycolicibacterium thermoresistibile]EHI13376.1 hypothetical protein KEK_09342 [Mycolicibacterium thermoresistibile ATCC 19527]MCV7189168.1 DUF3237 domain-containing protein [Mycolicibacterium thermoresistibile]GAT14642.1 putative uncharacterized protein [Mycolicibacterium thermoresistibile]SNW19869.1 Protein of uncharacterised function (DUF3237) [Mycolicibacterium thermoresistibile]
MTETLHATLRPLCHITYQLADPIAVSSGPTGSRTIGEITAARYEGERLKASLKGRAAADWAFVEPSGRVLVDARLTLETDDGATILVTYTGRMTGPTVHSAFFFETGDERYQWLTQILAVGKGGFRGESLEYEVYEVV